MAIPGIRGRAPRLGFSEGGWHAAEGLVLARYFMFTQVYFHKTRVAYDIHIREALSEILPGGRFPRPIDAELGEFLAWDDWRVFGELSAGNGGEHGRRLKDRRHYRLAYKSPEVPNSKDLAFFELLRQRLGGFLKDVEEAKKSWYKTGPPDIPIVNDVDPTIVKPLSEHSSVVRNMKESNQAMIYVSPEDAERAIKIVREEVENDRSRQGTLGFDPDAS